MSTLDILSFNSVEEFRPLRREFHRWFREKPERRSIYPVDTLQPLLITLPKGQEKEVLREIVREARMDEKLSFRFWWAVKLNNGQIALQVSHADIEGSERFFDICEKHQAKPEPE